MTYSCLLTSSTENLVTGSLHNIPLSKLWSCPSISSGILSSHLLILSKSLKSKLRNQIQKLILKVNWFIIEIELPVNVFPFKRVNTSCDIIQRYTWRPNINFETVELINSISNFWWLKSRWSLTGKAQVIRLKRIQHLNGN